MAAPDLIETERFLSLHAPGERVTFQTFDDDPRRKDRQLSRILHGTLAEHADTLANLNAHGAGVFWMANAGDGKGRTAQNVRRVRALFLDLDGSPLEPVKAATLPPHCIVESSLGHWHAYWRVADCALDRFKPTQQALAARFDGDAKVCDLPRVMRLPGFDHRKGEPFRTRIIALRADLPCYPHAVFFRAFAIDLSASPVAKVVKSSKRATVTALPTAPNRRTLPNSIPVGDRNTTLLSLAAGFVRKGFDVQAVTDRLQRINAERCTTPLCATEVDAIAARACGYGSDGFTILRDDLLDSAEWKALAPAAHDVILIAFRRYDGYNNGNIALTFADFAGRDGFGNSRTFYRHRSAAIASGILLLVTEGENSQTGRTPDLFAIASKWLHDDSAECQKGTMRQVPKRHSYIDKQVVGILGSDGAGGRRTKTKRDKAA